MSPMSQTVGTVLDQLTNIIEALQFTCKPLEAFDPQDDESCFNRTELAGFIQCLHSARNTAEHCFSLYCQILQNKMATTENPITPSIDDLQSHSDNPIVRGTLQGTLSEVINTLQFLIVTLEQVQLRDEERIFNMVEVAGLHNAICGIRAATEHCFEQCIVE